MSPRFVTVFAVVLLWSLPASAEPLERGALRLEWSAPGGCPNGVEVALRIEALLGARITDMTPEPIEARGKVTELAPLRYELELETRQRDQRFVRSMQAPSCVELSDAGALVLALAIDPTLAERRARAALAAPDTSALPTEQPPTAAEPAPAPTPPPGVVTTLDSGDPSDRQVQAIPFLPRWSARIGLLLDVGTVADVAYGFGVNAGVPFGSFRAELGFVWLPPARTVIATDPDRGGDVDLAAADLVGCWVPLRDELELATCAVVELGRLHGAGFGTTIESEGSAFWFSTGPRLLGSWKVTRGLSLAATAEVLFSPEANEFTLENVGVVHQVSHAVPRFGLAVQTEFY